MNNEKLKNVEIWDSNKYPDILDRIQLKNDEGYICDMYLFDHNVKVGLAMNLKVDEELIDDYGTKQDIYEWLVVADFEIINDCLCVTRYEPACKFDRNKYARKSFIDCIMSDSREMRDIRDIIRRYYESKSSN